MEEQDSNFMKIIRNFVRSVEKFSGNHGVILSVIARIIGELWSNFRQILRKIWGNSMQILRKFQEIFDNYLENWE